MSNPMFAGVNARQAKGLSRRSFLARALALGLTVPAISLLAACGEDEPAPEPAAPGVTPTPADEDVAEEETPAAGEDAPSGELHVAMPMRLVALDPHGPQAAEGPTQVFATHVFESLVTRNPETGEFEPALAVSWEAVEETTWEFQLREGVTYHDGSAVTAGDVELSLQRIKELAGPLAPLWASVESVDTPDDQTVRINTISPLGTVVASSSLLFVTPAARSDETGFFNEPVGCGAFRFVSWTPDAELRLEANEDYWGERAGLQHLIFREIPEIAARVTALETGEIDFTYTLPPDQLPPLRNNPDLIFDSTPSYTYYFNWFNAQREPFTDVRVRQAMWHALDIDTMVEDLLAGIGQRAEAPIPLTVFGAAPQQPYEYDPERAAALLVEAGYPDGFETTIQWNPGSGPQDRELVQTMIFYWNAIGVRVQNLEKERAQWLQDLLDLNWDMNFQTNTVRTGDADFTLRRLYHSTANRNGYANPELDEILDAAAETVDQTERAELYAEACRIIWEDAVGIFPFDLVENYVYRNRVVGFIPTPSQVPDFRRVGVTG